MNNGNYYNQTYNIENIMYMIIVITENNYIPGGWGTVVPLFFYQVPQKCPLLI